VLASGAGADLARCQKVLEALGEVRSLGPLGSGAAMKLAIMGVVVPVRVLLAEALNAAETSGVDRAALLDILDTRGLGSFITQTTPTDETRYALSHAVKDLSLAQQALGQHGETLSLMAAARTRLAAAERAGFGSRDLSAVYAYQPATRSSRAQKINPPTVPAPAGAYSHAVRVGDLLFVAGQAALDENGNVVGEGDIEVQSEFVFDCLERILADQGATFEDVVSIRTFLTDMTLLRGYGGVRTRRITGEPPSSTTVEVPKLFRSGLLVEVDVVVALPTQTA
jgi:enamine deaminase RidA (YjgF/YER057c/UK114 family)